MNAAAIQATVGADAAPLAAAGPAIAKSAETIAQQISKKFELKDIGKSMVAAFGIDIRDIAEQFARLFTGITKEAEESFKRLDELSQQSVELTIKSLEARRNSGQEIIAQEMELARLVREQTELRKQGALLATRNGVDKFVAKNNADLQANTVAMQKAGLALDEAKKKNQKDINELLKDYFADVEKGAEAIKKSDDAALKAAEAYEKKVEGLAALKKKAAFDQMTAEQQLVSLQTDAFRLQKEVNERRRNGVVDIDRETELYKIQQEIRERTLVVEKGISAEKRQQQAALERQNELTAKMNLALEDTLIIGDKAYGASRNPEQIAQASDKELQELIRRAKQNIAEIKAGENSTLNAATAASGFFVEEAAIDRQLTDIQRAMYALDQRASLKNANAFGGEDLARKNYAGDPLQFDSFFQRYVTGQEKAADRTNQLLEDLNEKFSTGKATVGTIDRG